MTNSGLILETISRLRQLTQVDVQSQWRCCFEDRLTTSAEGAVADVNAKGHIAWPKGRQVWLYQKFVLPEHLQLYPLEGLTVRLALTWWAEVAEVYVNGQLVQEGDLFDHSARVVLGQVVPGTEVEVAIRLISPGHDDGALMRSCLFYESNYDEIDPGFVADELEVIQSYIGAFELEEIEINLDWEICNPLQVTSKDRAQFNQALETLRTSLLPLSSQIKKHTIFLLGHAHLDMAWLWDVEETWKAAERTFTSVLNLQKDFPELTFCHTTPALYEWIEHHRPEIFAQIQAQVKAEKWEIIGGMWVEPEMNLITGESIARHLLYGQRYCQEKFGEICRVAWLPDTFGFNGQTPQLLRQAGIDYFVTQKLRWNDTTQFPYDWFDWQAPDGSQIKSWMSSPIGEAIDPIKMANFTWDWVKKTGQPNSLWLFGVGDHGGGPTRDMLEIAQRWQRSPFFPKLEFTTAFKYLESLESPKDTWNDELYLEFHRGCYTTHADQKKQNRKCEALLYQTELWASLATILTHHSYPKAELEIAWKKVLFNQFHDILPGSSIPQVFVDANREWQEVDRILSDIKLQSLKAIAHQISLPSPPHPQAKAIVVFNSLNWDRSQVVTLFEEGHQNWQIYTTEGQKVSTESTCCVQPQKTFSLTSFLADVPAIGYCCFWLCPSEINASPEPLREPYVLENAFLRATIDPDTGNLSSLFDKMAQREVLNGQGNQLQAFRDEGQYWDAWNIDPNYASHPLPQAELVSIANSSQQRFQSSISLERKIGRSVFYERYSLEPNSAVLRIFTQVDWQERHVLVKAAFPLNLDADSVTYEIACGAIQRTTKPQNDRDQAKWEVSALGWADLSQEDYGVSILSDCKHGYDCQPDQIRLTLLRGAKFPDPEADLGFHTFTYAIYPHAGTWQTAQTDRHSRELNQLLTVLKIDRPNPEGTRPAIASLLDLQSKNLILSAFKQSEANPEEYILRCYECHGQPAQLNLHLNLYSDLGLTILDEMNLLEDFNSPTANWIEPWQIKSFSVKTSQKGDGE
ncbi:alpha-mannosidase [Phormidesmis priestleyi]